MIWIKNIKFKSRTTFIRFDIMEFYPSLSKDLLLNSLNHANNFIDITEEQIENILTCWKSILTDSKSTWIKNCTENVDIPTGSYESV